MNRKRFEETKTPLARSRYVEFYDFRLDNLFRVEINETGVLIRTGRATCSALDRAFLVRHLAAEGFIPDCCQWLSDSPLPGPFAVRWVVDLSWIQLHHRLIRVRERFTRPFLAVTGLLFILVVPVFIGESLIDSALPRHPWQRSQIRSREHANLGEAA